MTMKKCGDENQQYIIDHISNNQTDSHDKIITLITNKNHNPK